MEKEISVFDELKGKTISKITGAEGGSDRVEIETTDGNSFVMYHSQDCCESVSLDEIHGDVADLVGSPILQAEEVSNEESAKEHTYGEGDQSSTYSDESHTWTFYKFATIKGSVTFRWYGTSNGYYSESVYFEKN